MIDVYPSVAPIDVLSELESMADDELHVWLWRYPGVIQDVFRVVSERFELFENTDLQRTAIQLYVAAKRKLWRGLWLGNIPSNMRMLVISTLCPGPLTQEILNFLTLADVSGARYEMVKAYVNDGEPPYGLPTLAEYEIDDETKKLAVAFSEQMIEDAAPHRAHAVLGAFVMERVPLPRLDALIEYDFLRLVISPEGIFGSLIKGAGYLTFWWSPEVSTTWSVGAKHAWAINTMMACIWRDACVIKHKMFQERSRSYKPAIKKRKQHNKKLVLPRIIKQCAWGKDVERQRITHGAHSVRAFYRQLPLDYQASSEAKETAAEFGYPLPPEGFTFVRPHLRGTGEVGESIAATPVICLGLQVAHLALSG